MNLLAKVKTLSWKLCSRMLASGRRAGLVLAQLNPKPSGQKLVALPTAKLGFKKPPAEGLRPGAMGPATIVGEGSCGCHSRTAVNGRSYNRANSNSLTVWFQTQ